MNKLIKSKIQLPSKTFEWKDRGHNYHKPASMETRHLFMTLVMIWNHTMPTDALILQSGNWTHHRYNLGSFYTTEYLAEAIGALAKELFTRGNLEASWQATLAKMSLYLQQQYNINLLEA